MGMHPGSGCSGSSIDQMAGFPGPLESAIEALSFGIGLRGRFQDGMRRIVRQVHKERLFVGIALRMVGDPFFGVGGPKVGGIALIKLAGYFFPSLVNFFRFPVKTFLGVVFVPVAVTSITEVLVEAPVQRKASPAHPQRYIACRMYRT